MLRASPLAPLCLVAAIAVSFVAPSTAQAADPVRTAPTTPRTVTAPAGTAGDSLSAAGRWIVMLRGGASVTAAETRARGLGVVVDRAFSHVVRGYSARLDPAQFAALREDPNVVALVPDAVIRLEAQSTPRGIRRVFGTRNPIARIDGIDQRVDADVAIVDTGIDKQHSDLNVVGGVNCSSSNPNAWDDGNGHGTHVAGIVGAIDNGQGVVGVAPGVRLWAVRILNSGGAGLVSWYVCGLDWITAQRDPNDPSRPLIEAANMSVAKTGKDDHNCGLTGHDPIHQAICRLVASGVTVVAAAGNNHFNAARLMPASYNEVITVSALADSDGKPGGLGGNACFSWGSYDRDDTFANFSNYGRDVDLIAPGKCIWSTVPGGYAYLSGTSMAAPHVTGAVALYKASRPLATPVQVRLALEAAGNHDWKVATDPDPYHEPLLDVSHIVNLGDFALVAASPAGAIGASGATRRIKVEAVRAEDVTGDMSLSVSADGPLSASLSDQLLTGSADTTSSLTLTVPPGTATGTYRATVTGNVGGMVRTVRVAVVVDTNRPSVGKATLGVRGGTSLRGSRFAAVASWPAGIDATTAIAGYQARWRVDGGAWGAAIGLGSASTSIGRTFAIGHVYRLQVRTRDAAGNWSTWTETGPFTARIVQDNSPSLVTTHTWHRSVSSLWSGHTTRYARAAGASISRSFTGRGIAVVAPFGRNRGAARVYVDGVLVRALHLHRKHTHPRRVVFSRTWATSGSHTIRIVVAGTRGHPRVDVDAFVIVE